MSPLQYFVPISPPSYLWTPGETNLSTSSTKILVSVLCLSIDIISILSPFHHQSRCQDTIAPDDSIWFCSQCFQIFHLKCIKDWAIRKANTTMEAMMDDRKPIHMQWNCPWFVHYIFYNTLSHLSRCNHVFSKIPDVYRCFCGKAVNPPSKPGVVPHCCTNICGKIRRANCPHRCTLPCHPGPCPPCGAFSPNVVCWSHHTPIGVRCGDTSLFSPAT